MPSAARTLFVALQFAALAAFLIFGTTLTLVPVLASPIPMPLSASGDGQDLVIPRSLTTTEPAVATDPKITDEKRDVVELEQLADAMGVKRRDSSAFASDFKLLDHYYGQMGQHAMNFRKLSRQSDASSSGGSGFEQRCAYELTGFQENLGNFQGLLAQMGSDKGLANYDKNNALETLLKNVVNANKYMLNDLDAMVYQLPAVGSTLGPIVYEIKCILDEVLDAVENLTDAILNDIQPLLEPVIQQATGSVCATGIQIAGLCIVL